ncbi:MAG: hypothetical protein ACOX57_08970 [Limnochordia bacterium]
MINTEFGEAIFQLGVWFLPVSFFTFLLLRPLVYLWNRSGTELLKAIWYLSAGMGTFGNWVELDMILGFIAFIEAYDLVFRHLENRRQSKSRAQD